jgi:methyl-accepting chemotaxis protein
MSAMGITRPGEAGHPAGGGASSGRGGFRWTISRKLAGLVAVAIVLTGVLGLVVSTDAAGITAANRQLDAVQTANTTLVDLDATSNDIQNALMAGLLAGTDDAAKGAAADLATAAANATRDWSAIEAVGLTGAAGGALGDLKAAFETYVSGEQGQFGTFQKTEAGSPAAAQLLIDDRARADAIAGRIADTRKVLAEALSVSDAVVEGGVSTMRTSMIVAVLLQVLLLCGIGWLVGRGIRRSLDGLRERMSEIADGDGDLTARIDESGRDEISDVAHAVNRFIARVQQLVTQLSGASRSLSGAVDNLVATGSEMASGAEETSVQAGVVSAAADEVSRNVATLSAGSEQMGASIREIASNAADAAQVAAQAVHVADSAYQKVNELAQASQEISNVVALITSIAEQTNLLALNATIEAARAGDAGKGFAVVAGEVKDLANDTAKATDDITRRVAAIQEGTSAAAGAISMISEVVSKVSDYSTTIASAVEEQTATTAEMVRSVTEAATGSNEIAANITGVAQAASTTASAVASSSQTTTEIADVVRELQAAVGRYRF